MLDFISLLVGILVQMIATVEQFLSFVFNMPVILWGFFVSLPLFMQVGFAVLLSFFTTFLAFKIYAIIH